MSLSSAGRGSGVARRRRAFAIVHTWPEIKNAEYEVLHRIVATARRIDADVVIVDSGGQVLWTSEGVDLFPGELLRPDAVDFLLSLHFESPRVLDVYSYITLWQPIEFYHEFGYTTSIDKVCSHNGLISCDSDIADAHGLNLMAGMGRMPALPLPKMFHTLPEPFLEPRISDESRIFYIGINWERVGKPRGRYHDLLVALDSKELIDIYGPEELLGVVPWEGFKSYRGELPFDGESIKYALNRAGVCLALSSLPHKNAGIMSNRLFEGLAGGAAVIASPNALIDKYFRDVVYLVDDSRGDAVLAQQIQEALRRIRANPEEARRRTLEGQRILREQCSLEDSLEQLFAAAPADIARHESSFLADAEITVVLNYSGASPELVRDRIAELARQKRCTIALHVVCDRQLAGHLANLEDYGPGGSIASIEVHPGRLRPAEPLFDGIPERPVRSGQIVGPLLREIRTPYFALLAAEDLLFSEHFASLAQTLERDPAAMFACSGMVVQDKAPDGRPTRSFDSARFVDFDGILAVTGGGQSGRFLFRSELLRGDHDALMTLLDGQEHLYFRLAAFLAGPLAQSSYTTYVLDQSRGEPTGIVVEPLEHQRQAIRDIFARDHRWLDRLSRSTTLPQFVYAGSLGTRVQWRDYAAPPSVARRLVVDRNYSMGGGGEGLRYLAGGFSEPEAAQTWLAGERGVLIFSIAPPAGREPDDLVIQMSVAGRPSAINGRDQHCTIAVNGNVIGYHRLPASTSQLTIPLPFTRTERERSFYVEIIPDHAEMVYDEAGNVVDERRLSVALMSLAVERVSSGKLPLFSPGETYRCGSRDYGSAALVRNFYYPEDEFTWMTGTSGFVCFELNRSIPRPRLQLRVHGRHSLESGAPLRLRVVANRCDLGEQELAGDTETLEFDLSSVDLASGRLWIELRASHAEAVFDAEHQIVDSRLLGLAVEALGVVEGAETSNERPEDEARDGADDVPANDDWTAADPPADEDMSVSEGRSA